MNNQQRKLIVIVLKLSSWMIVSTFVNAQAIPLAQSPITMMPKEALPNILLIYDNSSSMGRRIESEEQLFPNDPNTRSNITRIAVRTILNNYRSEFNWGLEIFDFKQPITKNYNDHGTFAYDAVTTGIGTILEPVAPDSAAHFNRFMMYLAPETNDLNTSELKSSTITPIFGSLLTAEKYFRNQLPGWPSPIKSTCQKNFVLLATDGYPNTTLNGVFYPNDELTSAKTGRGYTDVYRQIDALRSTGFNGRNYDIQTYVMGVGSELSTSVGVEGLNTMARHGGTEKAFITSSADSIKTALLTIARDILTKISAGSAVALSKNFLDTGTLLFKPGFKSGEWSGMLSAYPIDRNAKPGSTPVWDAGKQLDSQHWNTGRQILSYKPSAPIGARGIAFRWPKNPLFPAATEMEILQSQLLNRNWQGTLDNYGSRRIDYLRGNRANEQSSCGSCVPAFRSRKTVLGDIVNSSPYFLSTSEFGYSDWMEYGNTNPYSTFVNKNKTRMPVLYVGANDGMLHAFNANTGKEIFAYVPASVYKNLSYLTSLDYNHRYFVDGSPTVGDVFYDKEWHSLLVGHLGAGGQGIFALDVTHPESISEKRPNDVVRWEFSDSNDPDMGNVFSSPVLVKSNDPNHPWVVILGNGYNSTVEDGRAGNSGHALLFILDAKTGAIVRKIDTGSGNRFAPNGLSGPAVLDTNGDNIADSVYAGDLAGHLWKFDISSTSPQQWGLAFQNALPLFSTPGQAITVKPDITLSPEGGYMVVFGTGKFLGTDDLANSSTQYFYGIWDNGKPVQAHELQEQNILSSTARGTDGNFYRLSTHAVGKPGDKLLPKDNQISADNYTKQKRGWFMALPSTGERVVTEASIRGGRVIFTTMMPTISTCGINDGTGWVMELNVNNGNRLDGVTFDTNNNTMLTHDDLLNQINTTGRFINGIPAQPKFIKRPTPPGSLPIENKYINTSGATVENIVETSAPVIEGRILWKRISPPAAKY